MSLLAHTPNFSAAAAASLAEELYGVRATASSLPGERDQNFLIETDTSEKFVLKIANGLEERTLLEAQQQALTHLARFLSFCPSVVPTITGEFVSEVATPAGRNLMRLVTYIPGIPLADIGPHSPRLLRDLGNRMAQVDRALESFDHPALHRDFHWDLANGLRVISACRPLIIAPDRRLLIDRLVADFERDTLPLLPRLRRSAIHNDGNDYNVLVTRVQGPAIGTASSDRGPHAVSPPEVLEPRQEIAGLVDFGDLVHSFTVGDLAVTIAYAVLNKPAPLAAAALVAEGYHREYPLQADEIAALFGLITLRLGVSVCLAAQQQQQRPDDEYLSISQDAIQATLPKLAAIGPQLAAAAFREACPLSGARTRVARVERLSSRAPRNGRPGEVLATPVAETKAETLAQRQKHFARNLQLAYTEPIKVVRGSMQYLYDEEGREYLDAYNNVPHVGHCHPRVVEAGRKQMGVLNTNTRYLHDLMNRYAESLTETLPASLSVCFFVNSGSEANELALRLARAHTGSRELIVLEHAYHGNTTTLIEISPYKHNGPGGAGAPPWVHTAPIPDVYRGLFQDESRAGEQYAAEVARICRRVSGGRHGLGGFIAESLPSVAGQIIFPAGYLPSVYQAVRAAGGVCIADEVQTGYGRIGTHFWGFESYGVVPDIVVLGKPIGNGHPIGAVITTAEIAESFTNGMEFFSTFGGNTVSCAIGLEVLMVVLADQLQAHALEVGNHLLAGLRRLMTRYSIIGDVRGSGLFLGVELVRDRATREPATAEASTIANRLCAAGILLGTDGPFDNVLKIRPPMPFSRANADLLCLRLESALDQ